MGLNPLKKVPYIVEDLFKYTSEGCLGNEGEKF